MTDLRGVDLVRTAFDFDLTFAALLMHPDGHVYHRYGGRDERGADVWLSLESWERLLARTLDEHAAYVESRSGAEADEGTARPERLVLEKVPAFARRDKGACIHCHSVFPALYEQALADGSWSEERRWVYPPPGRLGLDLDRDEQTRVVAVRPDSVAARAGVRPGDRLARAAGRPLATASDLSRVLHDLPPDAGTLEIELAAEPRAGGQPRDGRTATLRLDADWKRGTPLEFSWRPFKWGFTPAPGFGGPELDAAAKAARGLDAERFAFEVSYLVTWGDNARYGEEARRAGLREGDVFVSAAGRDDFASGDHFHAWWRLTREPGDDVEVVVLRGGERLRLTFRVVP